MAHHGVNSDDRWPQVRERIAAMRTLWREDRPRFDGRLVQFAPSFQYLKPVQLLHPSIILGTLDTPLGRSQMARYGDGWLPLTFSVKRTMASIDTAGIDDVKARMRARSCACRWRTMMPCCAGWMRGRTCSVHSPAADATRLPFQARL